jgi:hypothetical protein
MGWKVGAGLLLAVSLIGAIVRFRAGDYVYLSASLIGLGIAIWMWRKGEEGPGHTEGEGSAD